MIIIKKLSYLLGGIVLCSSCMGWDLRYRFAFYNNSNEDIYIILDNNTIDDAITIGSMCHYIQPGHFKYIDSREPWDTVIKDSIHIYVLDATKIQLPTAHLSQENAECISPEMVLTRKTLFNSQTHEKFSLSYP